MKLKDINSELFWSSICLSCISMELYKFKEQVGAIGAQGRAGPSNFLNKICITVIVIIAKNKN